MVRCALIVLALVPNFEKAHKRHIIDSIQCSNAIPMKYANELSIYKEVKSHRGYKEPPLSLLGYL